MIIYILLLITLSFNICSSFTVNNHANFFLKVIFGKSSGPEFLDEVYSPVTYHNKQVFTPLSCMRLFLSLLFSDVIVFISDLLTSMKK